MENQRIGQTKVLYNAECPVCSLEIDHYARISDKRNLSLGFHDLNNRDELTVWGLDEETAAKRLHVLKDNQLYSGIPAFLVLWREMPGYRHLARVVSLPGIYRLAVWSYDYVLAPALFRWHKHRSRRPKAS